MQNVGLARFSRKLLSGLLPALAWIFLSLPPEIYAQAAGALGTGTASAPKALFIEVLEGEGELNDVRARTAREPIVEVQDENHKPVAGALILFSLRSGSQAQASFSGLPTLSVRTGADGRAVARGYRITSTKGKIEIAVTATVGALVVTTLIHQTNVAHGGSFQQTLSAHKFAIGESVFLAGFAAAVITISVEARTPASTAITAGQGSVGAPAVRFAWGR